MMRAKVMTLVRALVALLVFAGTVPVAALADDMTPEKRADIEQLLQITGALSLGKQMGVGLVAQITQALKKARPDIPQRVLDALPEEVEAVFDANMTSFKEAMIPLYDKYFTGPEIKQMLQFYSTDLGKKAIRVMPALLQESMVVGQQWGQALSPMIDARIRARLKKEGIQI